MIALVGCLAQAQNVAQPAIDAQLFRPAVDSAFLWVDDAHPATPGPYGSFVAHYARDPLRYFTGVGLEPVVHDLAEVDLVAGYAVGPARFGVVAPVVARANGWAGGETGLGDLGLSARGALHLAAVDVGLDGRLWFPTTRVDAAVASRGLAGELALVASREVGPFTVAGNVGYRAIPFVMVDPVRVDDSLTARFGGGYHASEQVSVTAELAGQAGVRGGGSATLPVEALGGVRYTTGPLAFHGGLGRGLTTALGTPSVRVVAALNYANPARAPDHDTDHDGIVDLKDDCPRSPEDRDGWRDADGCPDDTSITARVLDERGLPLPHLQATLAGPGLSRAFVGALEIELPSGTYTLYTSDPGWLDATLTFAVGSGPPDEVDLVLHPRRVVVTPDRLELNEEIQFQTASATILQDSWTLLDEVVAQVRQNPEIARLRIEGHTDASGGDSANLDLSYRRASAVRDWLVGRGIEPSRVTAVGYGESQPLIPGNDATALAMNRRVEFFVESWISTNEVQP